jgi:tripartite ATP-independent transporter DctP family solute receptor
VKRVAGVWVIAAFFVLSFVGYAAGSVAAPIELIFATVQAVNNPEVRAMEYFGKLLEERTTGQVVLKIFPDSQLGSEREICEQSIMGSVDFTNSSPSLWGNVSNVPELAMWNLPFLFGNIDEQEAVIKNVFIEGTEEYLLQSGIRPLFAFSAGFRGIMSVKPVRTASDVAEKKIRTPEDSIYIDCFKLLGASPVPVPVSELYTALSSGMVDGCEFAPVGILNLSLFEVAKFFSRSNHIAPLHVIAINEEKWQSIPDDLKKIIKECGQEAQAYEINMLRNEEEKDLNTLEGHGVEIIPLTQADHEAMFSKVQPMYDKYRNDLGLGELLDKIATSAASVR